MKHLLLILVCCLSLMGGLFVSGCEKIIPYKGPTPNPVLVINSAFGPDSLWQVKISQSQSITDSTSGIITQAQVRIRSQLEGWEEDITDAQLPPGTYRTLQQRPISRGIYEIEVEAPGFSPVRAIDTVPEAPIIALLDTNFTAIDGIPVLQVDLQITDHPQASFYVIEAFLEFGQGQGEAFQPELYEFDPYIENEGLGNNQGFFDRLFLPDTGWKNDTITVSFAVDGIAATDSLAFPEPGQLLIRVSSVSPAYYAYQRSFVQYSLAFNWVSFPQPVHVFSNVQGGLGIFGGYAAEEIWVEL